MLLTYWQRPHNGLPTLSNLNKLCTNKSTQTLTFDSFLPWEVETISWTKSPNSSNIYLFIAPYKEKIVQKHNTKHFTIDEKFKLRICRALVRTRADSGGRWLAGDRDRLYRRLYTLCRDEDCLRKRSLRQIIIYLAINTSGIWMATPVYFVRHFNFLCKVNL